MDGWITCYFTSFSTVFQSYQDDGWVIMEGCVQWNLVYRRKDFRLSSAVLELAFFSKKLNEIAEICWLINSLICIRII